jgi:hypothetical protein
MNKIMLILLAMLLLSAFAFAENNDNNNDDTNVSIEDLRTLAKQDVKELIDSRKELVREQINVMKARILDMNERKVLRNQIKDKKEELKIETEQIKDNKRKMAEENQNRVRLAVHSMLAIKNTLNENLGRQISEIARDFNNSVRNRVDYEERIQNRGWSSRMFAGGDLNTGMMLRDDLNKTQRQLEHLTLIRDECTDCDEEVLAIINEHIEDLNTEQTRLGQIADNEIKSKGLLGWLWK